jgi:drug/metabolite transporter (DMT)-like permease
VPATERRSFAVALTALILGAVAMGASPIFVRLADVGPHASAFWRTFLALPVLWLWMRLEASGNIAPAFRDGAVLLAGLFFAGDLFFWHLSILGTTVANATFLATMAPIWVALAAWIIFKEKIDARMLAGLALCIAGGAALVGQSYGYNQERLPGDAFGAVTALFFAAYILATRVARGRYGPGRLSFVSTAVTCACLFAIALAIEPTLWPRSASGAAALVALALVSQVGGQGLLAVALGALPATFSALVIFIEAVAATFFAWLLFTETLGPLQLAGGAAILAGIWIARPRANEPATT